MRSRTTHSPWSPSMRTFLPWTRPSGTRSGETAMTRMPGARRWPEAGRVVSSPVCSGSELYAVASTTTLRMRGTFERAASPGSRSPTARASTALCARISHLPVTEPNTRPRGRRSRAGLWSAPMRETLVFVSGGSSGIGEALIRTLPFSPARVLDLSRRGVPGFSGLRVDLADPAAWPRVAELFGREIGSFAGERVVFFHAAGTLTPIGFAGDEDAAAYARAVLLNAAAPQVLGDAFLRAAHATRAPCHLVMIGSGAARNVYPGWSSYGAGKAALDQWVRTVGAEQELRGGRCRALSVSPGLVATAMQQEIRATPPGPLPGGGPLRRGFGEGR